MSHPAPAIIPAMRTVRVPTFGSICRSSIQAAPDADNPILRGSQPVQENGNLTEAFTRRLSPHNRDKLAG